MSRPHPLGPKPISSKYSVTATLSRARGERGRFMRSVRRGDVEPEPLRRERPHPSIGDGGLDGGMELRDKLGVALAQADGDTEAKRTAAVARPGERHV